jgi:succinoglycan biosynthesis protein ExoA
MRTMTHPPGEPAAAPGPGVPAAEAVSVVMPVRNEERHLEESVRSVLGQDYPGEFEVVLAVGPSRDRTLEVSRRLAAADPRVTVVPNPSGAIPSAVNAAIKASRHSIVARVDGHSLLPPGYLRAAVRELGQTGADNVGGIMAAQGVTPFQQAVAWAMTSRFGVGAAKFHTGGRAGAVDSVYLGVYRRAAIDRAGGYDESYQRAEDWELNHRIRLAGGLIWFLPELQVCYRPRAAVRALAEQYFHYGRWRRVVVREHPGTVSPRYLAPPVAVLVMAAGAVAGLAGLAGLAAGWGAAGAALAVAGFAVPAAYLAGTLGAAAVAARPLGPRIAALIPLVLATMHVCWGVGFLTSPRSLMPGHGPPRARAPLLPPAAACPTGQAHGTPGVGCGPPSPCLGPLLAPPLRRSWKVFRVICRKVSKITELGGPQQGLGHVEVAGVCDLDVALAAGHDADRYVRQVAQHDAAVVGGRALRERRVGVG